MQIALAIICKGSDSEAALLDRCLESMAPHVDGIFITRTQLPGEEKNLAVEAVASEYGAVLSDFEWIQDFAAARNFNFSQVPKDFDYIIWSDADDVWRGLELLKTTLEENKLTEAFGINYLYDWDESKKPTVVHRKTMIVKNDGCVVWEGRLHEDLVGTRQIDVQFIKGIDRCHLTTMDRVAENSKRNLSIAEKQVDESPDDPRSYWNLANSQFATGDFEGAKATFTKFLEDTESEDERYLAYSRLSDVYKALNDRSEAIKHLQIAIGLRPELPDAYFQLAHTFFSYGNMDKAEEYCIQGLLRRPQPDKMIVYNPRDYDYNPMMLMARVYFEKNRPDKMVPFLKGCLAIYPDDEHLKNLVKEGEELLDSLEKALTEVQRLKDITDKDVLKAELDKLPIELKSHPSICVLRNQNFVKTESSGRDLVIYCGMTDHQWNPELFKTKGFGGSEEAVVHLAREWAKLGWNVTVYNNCGHTPVTENVSYIDDAKPYAVLMDKNGKTINNYRTVTYRPFWEWNYRDKQDVTILWRWVKALDADINSTKIFVDLHDVVPQGEFTEKRIEKVDRIFVKTQFHRSLIPNVPDEKVAVIPNGFETYADPSIEKDPYLVINTSSPDRSMDVLPGLWKLVKAALPDEIRAKVKFKWAYGFDVYKASFANDPKKIQWMEETIAAMDDAGIEQLGKLPQAEVAKLYQQAAIMAYPSDFAEIDCISVKKAQAAKCMPVTTDFGAFAESIRYGMLVRSTKDKDSWAAPYQFHFGLTDETGQADWVNKMVLALETSPRTEWAGLDEWVEGFKWENIASRWNEILKI